MPRGKNCRETSFAAQLPRNYPHRGDDLKEDKTSSLVGRGKLGGILRVNLGEGNCESKIAARQWGVNFCREALSGPVRDTPPYRAIPFRDTIAEGGVAPICLVFIGISREYR